MRPNRRAQRTATAASSGTSGCSSSRLRAHVAAKASGQSAGAATAACAWNAAIRRATRPTAPAGSRPRSSSDGEGLALVEATHDDDPVERGPVALLPHAQAAGHLDERTDAEHDIGRQRTVDGHLGLAARAGGAPASTGRRTRSGPAS